MRLRGTGILRTPNSARVLRTIPVALAVCLAALAMAAVASARQGQSIRQLSFHGYHLAVPAAWPVYDLTRDPATCVRFNRHAVYLGTPSGNQRCPAHAVGRTEAILLAPLSAGTTRAGSGASSPRSLPKTGSSTTFVVGSGTVIATVAWSHNRGLLASILHRRLGSNNTDRPPPVARHPAARASAATKLGPVARTAESQYHGLGFDACSAPSANAMSAWASSSYRAVGVYIGGINEACSQPNLTPGWVDAEVAAGWHLIPTYVGYQGRGSCGGTCATINPGRASAQGRAAAQDAISQAQALGIRQGNPIYDDMEQYAGSSANTAAVLAFLAGWTSELHAAGYRSGVYGSGTSAITNLVNRSGTGYTEPDDLWIGDWNGRHTTTDPYVPSSEWNGARIHQYSGAHDETHGGISLNIDGDYLNGATADASSPIPDGTFVQTSDVTPIYEMAGGAPMYVTSWLPFVYPEPVQMITAQQFATLSRYPANGTFIQTTDGLIYRIAGGAPIAVSSWSVFGEPEPDTIVDAWDLANIGNPLVNLRLVPANGTVVEGLPSHQYWSFEGGLRTPHKATATAVQVDDIGLQAFAQGPASVTDAIVQCVTPPLSHMTLTRARNALKRSDCSVGRVRKPKHIPPHHVLRVRSQSAVPQSLHPVGYRVNLRLA